jgi:chitinase
MRFGQRLFDAFKTKVRRTPVRAARSGRFYPRRLGLEALEDRAVPASFSISDVSIVEGNSGTRNAVVTVSLTGASSQPTSVGYSTASGSAHAGTDYQAASGTLNFGKGVTSKTIQVPIIGDTLVESDETFYVNLKNPKKATIADGQGVVTIVDDDTSISIDSVWESEGNSGTTSFNFTVHLSKAIGQPVTVNYATADGTATAGSDYVAASGKLTIPAGQTSGTITVLVNGDGVSEPDETFYVNLSNPSSGRIADPLGVGTIMDDEAHVYIDDVSSAEGNDGTTAFNFTVSLSTTSDDPVTVDFATADVTASTADGDYVPTSGTLTFAPGETSKVITVLVNGDQTVEPDETFVVNLSNATNARFDRDWGVGTILSDDNAVLHIDTYVYASEPDPYTGGVTTMYFNVWLSAPSSESVTVNYSTFDGSALAWLDYTPVSGQLTFAPGETSKTIEVAVLADWEIESPEDFSVMLSAPSSNAVIQPGWELGTGTIYDNQGDSGW